VDGDLIAKHNGLMYYTLGQRQGLGIGGLNNYSESPWYVVDKDSENNRLIVAQDHEHPKLMRDTLTCKDLDWVARETPIFPLNCTAKIRYRHTDVPCTITQKDDGCFIAFTHPQRAITPGQSVVFYENEVCLGGGIII